MIAARAAMMKNATNALRIEGHHPSPSGDQDLAADAQLGWPQRQRSSCWPVV
jgi:hypothetical protein